MNIINKILLVLFGVFILVVFIPVISSLARAQQIFEDTTTTSKDNTIIYIEPNPVEPSTLTTVTTTGTTGCFTKTSYNFGAGLTSCVQSGGFSCSGNPKGDGNPCWWKWTCKSGTTPGVYTATFNAAGTNCASSKSYKINSIVKIGGINGTVRQLPDNALLPGVTVSLVGTAKTVVTSATGSWVMTDIPSGPTKFTFSKTGFVSKTEIVTIPEGLHSVSFHIQLAPVPAITPTPTPTPTPIPTLTPTPIPRPQVTAVTFNGVALDITGQNAITTTLRPTGVPAQEVVPVVVNYSQGNPHTFYVKFIYQPPVTPTPTPIPNPDAYNINVLVIKYFPLTSDRQNIDITVTGDVGEPYQTVRQHTIDVTNNLKSALERASKYLGYRDSSAPSSLLYQILDTREYTQAVPIRPRPDKPRYPDYNGIMTAHNICDWVDNRGVREVWIWAYQGPNRPDGHASLEIWESKMSGPYGDISNSGRYNDMPVCRNTYRVYTFNYGRGTTEALESWSHQIEAELDAITVDRGLFRNKFQGPNYPQTLGVTGRCGSVHNPPNARFEYERSNRIPQNSDCLDWNPDSLGTLSPISCDNWSSGCRVNGDNDNPDLNYMIWNWQNIPGAGNNKTFQGRRFRNWWDIHGDFDNVMGNPNNRTLFLVNIPTPTPSPTGRPSPTPFSNVVPCDGNNDQIKINNAVNALPASGGTVILPGRQCNLSGPIIPKANTVLEGAGTTTKLFKTSNFNNNMIVNSNVGGKVTIRKMEIDGNKNVATENKSAIELGNAANSLFEDLYIHNVRLHGIVLRAGSNNAIARRIRTEDIGTMVINDDGTGQGRGAFQVGETVAGNYYNLRATVTSITGGYQTITIKGLTSPIGEGMILTGQSSGAKLKIRSIGATDRSIRGNAGGPFIVGGSSGVEISDSQLLNSDRGLRYDDSPNGRIVRVDVQNVYSQTCMTVGNSDGLLLDHPQVKNCVQHNGIALQRVNRSRIISPRSNGAFLAGLAILGSYNEILDPQVANYGNNGVDAGVVFEYRNLINIPGVPNNTAYGSKYNTVTGGLADGTNDRANWGLSNGHSGFSEESGTELVGTPNGNFQDKELVIGETSGARAGIAFQSPNGIVARDYLNDPFGQGRVKYIKGNFQAGEIIKGQISQATMRIQSINHLVDNNTFTNVRSINHNTELGSNYVPLGPNSTLDFVLDCTGHESTCWDSVIKQQGTAVVRAGTKTVTVPHNLRYPPKVLTLNAKDATVTNKTWNNFVIALDANAVADRQIGWYAERYQPATSSPAIVTSTTFNGRALDLTGTNWTTTTLTNGVGNVYDALIDVTDTSNIIRHLIIKFIYQPPAASNPAESSKSAPTVIQQYDLNDDKIVNSVDIGLFFNEWRKRSKGENSTKGDFNNDKAVNSIDYSILKNNISY